MARWARSRSYFPPQFGQLLLGPLTTRSDRALAIRVATDVLGWELWDEKDDYAGAAPIFFAVFDASGRLAVYRNDDPSGDVDRHVSPASDLSDFVSEVVPAMRAKGFTFELRERDVLDGTTWEAVFSNPATRVCKYDRANPARAGCLAALRALEQTT